MIFISSPRNGQNAKWRKFTYDIKETIKVVYTSGKQKISKSSNSITNNKEITVQLLAGEATEKAQKFERKGRAEFVALLF